MKSILVVFKPPVSKQMTQLGICAKQPIRNWFQMESRTCRLNSVICSGHMVGGFRNAYSARPSYT